MKSKDRPDVESNMHLLLLAALSLAPSAPQGHFPGAPADRRRTVYVGWHDEMESRSYWGPLNMQNKAFVAQPTKGTLFLGLDQVPDNWHYEYQWSGLTREANVNVASYPILMARVRQVQGYAHLDIDILGAKGEVVETVRSSTLNAPGLSTIDLGPHLPAGYHRLRLRLIVGGPNQGCCATYDWVRFVNKSDAAFLTLHPDWDRVRLGGLSMR